MWKKKGAQMITTSWHSSGSKETSELLSYPDPKTILWIQIIIFVHLNTIKLASNRRIRFEMALFVWFIWEYQQPWKNNYNTKITEMHIITIQFYVNREKNKKNKTANPYFVIQRVISFHWQIFLICSIQRCDYICVLQVASFESVYC